MSASALEDCILSFRDRFLGGTLPIIIEHGWDHIRGGVVERLDAETRDIGLPYRRFMVHARQLYLFSQWAEKLEDRTMAELADRIFAYIIHKFWDDTNGGWFEKVDLDGERLDTEKNLYSHAFGLFGLGSYRRFLHRTTADFWLERTFEILVDRFSRSDGSFADRMSREFQDLVPGRRSQNPHMHLLEAALFLSEMSDNYSSLALDVLSLFETRFLVVREGVVLEHLDDNFRPHLEDGHRIEPGHHFEWAWLLDWAARKIGNRQHHLIGRSVLETGLKLGWDPEHGGIFDELRRSDGQVILSTKRIWPITELIKALTVHDIQGPVNLERTIWLLNENYLSGDGRWIERLDTDWTPADRTMPASTPYHLSMALTQVLNYLDKIRGEGNSGDGYKVSR